MIGMIHYRHIAVGKWIEKLTDVGFVHQGPNILINLNIRLVDVIIRREAAGFTVDARWMGSSLRDYIMTPRPVPDTIIQLSDECGEPTDLDWEFFIHHQGNLLTADIFSTLIKRINLAINWNLHLNKRTQLFNPKFPVLTFRSEVRSPQCDIAIKNGPPASYPFGPTLYGVMASSNGIEFLHPLTELHIRTQVFFVPFDMPVHHTLMNRYIRTRFQIIQPLLFDMMLAALILKTHCETPDPFAMAQLKRLNLNTLSSEEIRQGKVAPSFTFIDALRTTSLSRLSTVSSYIKSGDNATLSGPITLLPVSDDPKKKCLSPVKTAIQQQFLLFFTLVDRYRDTPHYSILKDEFKSHLLFGVAFRKLALNQTITATDYLGELARILDRDFTEDERQCATAIGDIYFPPPSYHAILPDSKSLAQVTHHRVPPSVSEFTRSPSLKPEVSPTPLTLNSIARSSLTKPRDIQDALRLLAERIPAGDGVLKYPEIAIIQRLILKTKRQGGLIDDVLNLAPSTIEGRTRFFATLLEFVTKSGLPMDTGSQWNTAISSRTVTAVIGKPAQISKSKEIDAILRLLATRQSSWNGDLSKRDYALIQRLMTHTLRPRRAAKIIAAVLDLTPVNAPGSAKIRLAILDMANARAFPPELFDQWKTAVSIRYDTISSAGKKSLAALAPAEFNRLKDYLPPETAARLNRFVFVIRHQPHLHVLGATSITVGTVMTVYATNTGSFFRIQMSLAILAIAIIQYVWLLLSFQRELE